MFKIIKQTSKYKDAWLELFQDEVEFPDGSIGTYAWANRRNGVAIVVTTNNKTILLHKEYRYVIKNYSWEIQGGGIDKGETPEQAAIRELNEEAGISIQPSLLKKIGVFYPLNSFNTESVTLFMVIINPVKLTASKTEPGESIGSQQYVSFDNALEMIDSGEINDAFTANAVQLAIRKFNNQTPTLS